jgi:hypothetical protein
MPYYPPDFRYHTPTRPSRHEHSYYRQQPSISETGTVNYSPKCVDSNHPGSSPTRFRPKAPRLSRRLISLISKFETLDATSLPYDIPSLQPAHLRLHSHSLRGRKQSGKQQRKGLPTIFSPLNKPTYQRHSPIDQVANAPISNVLEDPIRLESIKKSGSGRLRQVSSPHRNFNLRLRHVDGGGSSEPISVPKKQRDDRDKRRSTVRDGIRFWNEGFEKSKATSRSQVYQPSPKVPSVYSPYCKTTTTKRTGETAQQTVPFPLKRRKGHKKAPCTNPACVKRQEASGAKAAASLLLSTRIDEQSTSKIRKLHFQGPEQYPLAEKREDTTISDQIITPELSPKAGLVEKVELHPKIQRSSPHYTHTSPVTHTHTTKETSLPGEDLRKIRFSEAMKARPSRHDMRDISNKIEAVYSARRMEKSAEVGGISSQQTLRQSPAKLQEKKEVLEPLILEETSRASTRQASKVASMKNFFDGPRTEEPTHQNSLASLPAIPSLVYKKIKEKAPKYRWVLPSRLKLAHPSPSEPQPPQPLHLSRIPRFSPTSAASKHIAQRIPVKKSLTATGQHLLQPIAKTRKPQVKTAGIGDRIRLFESPKSIDRQSEVQAQAKHILGQPSASVQIRKSQFEHLSGRADGNMQRKALSVKEVEDIINELRGRDGGSMIGRGHAAKGNKSQLSMVSTGTGMSARLDGASLSARNMIVKEAKCGLRQPRPVRLDEVRRMVSLCRSKNIGDVDNDKSRALKPRQL